MEFHKWWRWCLMMITKVIVMIMSLKIWWVFQTRYDQLLYCLHYCLQATKYDYVLYV